MTFERVREETTPYLQTKNPMKTTRWGVGVGIINISLVTCMILVIYPVRIWWFINANLRDNRRVWSVRYETQSKIDLQSSVKGVRAIPLDQELFGFLHYVASRL